MKRVKNETLKQDKGCMVKVLNALQVQYKWKKVTRVSLFEMFYSVRLSLYSIIYSKRVICLTLFTVWVTYLTLSTE
jgi:hypothetical protein